MPRDAVAVRICVELEAYNEDDLCRVAVDVLARRLGLPLAEVDAAVVAAAKRGWLRQVPHGGISLCAEWWTSRSRPRS
jgi:predicted Rossmann fold nucleotide-binding protein DprA/Smf involved in DNA uptake